MSVQVTANGARRRATVSVKAARLTWRRIRVAGRDAQYGAGGRGPVVVFLHGWGIGYRSYKGALASLVAMGFRVIAPGLPGLSGTDDLPADQRSLSGYAQWVGEFLDAVGVDEPVILVGHSFGGGVAIATAHAAPERVCRLVLVNSIGGSAWTRSRGVLRSLAERPLWDWGLHFPADVLPLRQLRRVLPVILEDAVPNLLHNPGGIIRVANLARSANLERELSELKALGLPVVVLWGAQDSVLPRLSFEALRDAAGGRCVTVPGGHSWLIADPAAFGEVMTNVVGLPERVIAIPRPRRSGENVSASRAVYAPNGSHAA